MKVLAVMGAWLPIFLFWLFFSMAYARISFAEALSRAVLNIGSAAILGTAVWRLSARAPWPREMKLSFYAGQLVAAAVYATLWTVSMYAFEALIGGMPFLNAVASSRVLGWQFLMGLWLYGVIAGICYAIQTQQRAESNERRALLAETALTEARLEALRSRLHPHFLFNALHTIHALVEREPARAANMLHNLSELLRLTLGRHDRQMVMVATELEAVRLYLAIQQERFGERLNVTESVGEGALACLVPDILLQPIVENAVVHGIAPIRRGGTVAIDIECVADRLAIPIADNGAGLPGYVEEGIGLGTTRARLLHLYGADHHFSVSNQPGGGTIVKIELPVRREAHE